MVLCVFVFQAALTTPTSDQGFIVPTIDSYPIPVTAGECRPKISYALGLVVFTIT